MESKLLWNNKNIEVVKIDNCWYALDGWNGEKYTDCWRVDDNTFYIEEDNARYTAEPVYSPIAFDDMGEACEWEISNYIMRKGD